MIGATDVPVGCGLTTGVVAAGGTFLVDPRFLVLVFIYPTVRSLPSTGNPPSSRFGGSVRVEAVVISTVLGYGTSVGCSSTKADAQTFLALKRFHRTAQLGDVLACKCVVVSERTILNIKRMSVDTKM